MTYINYCMNCGTRWQSTQLAQDSFCRRCRENIRDITHRKPTDFPRLARYAKKETTNA